MKNRIIMAVGLFIALVLISSLVSAEGIIEINLLVFSSGAVAMDYRVNDGQAGIYSNESGSYMLGINDASGAPLWKRNYDLNFFKLSDPPRKTEYEIITEKIPYDSRMYEIAFYKDNEIILQKYLDVCDYNLRCDKKENAVSCPSDCSIADYDGICIAKEDDICDPDCISDIDCAKQEKKQKEAFAFTSIGLSVLIVALLVFVHRKRKRILHLIGKAKAEYERLVSKLKDMGKPVKKNVRRR
ncbi:MAG: hypothetical protein AABX27_00495 [Nanoarchaeota archaeon]